MGGEGVGERLEVEDWRNPAKGKEGRFETGRVKGRAGAGAGAQLVLCLSNIHETLGSIASTG